MRRAFVLGRTLCIALCLGLLGIAAAPAQAASGPLLAYMVPRGDTQAAAQRRAGGSLYAEIALPPNFNPQGYSATVLTLLGDEIDRYLGWIGPTTYLETDPANRPGDFGLRIVDLTGDDSRQLWPGMHRAFALDLGRERLAVSGAVTSTGWVFPQETFLVDLASGDFTTIDDPGAVASADGALLAALAGGTTFWRPDGLGYFVIKGARLSYHDRASGAATSLDQDVRALEWLAATHANPEPDPAQRGSTLAGSARDIAYALREAQAAQLAALAFDPILQPPALPGLPLLLAREAVLTTLRPVFDLIPAPYVLPQAEAALRTAIDPAPPWVGEFPTDGPLGSLRSLALSQDGAWIATGHGDGALRLWEQASGRLARTFAAETAGIQQVAFSPSGDYLAAVAESGVIHIWDMADWNRATSYAGRYRSATTIAWEPAGSALLIADGATPVQRLAVHERLTRYLDRPAEALAFSADGRRFAAALRPVYPTGGEAGQRTPQPPQTPPILLRDLESGTEVELPDPDGITYILAFSPDGRYLVSSSAYTLRVWDAADGTLLHTVALPDFPNGSAFTAADMLAVLSRRFGVTFVDVRAGRVLRSLPVDANQLGWLAYDAGRGRLVSADVNGRPVHLDPVTGAVEYPFDNPEARLVAAHPTQPLAITGGGKVVGVRDLDSGATRHTLTGLNAVVTALTLSLDGDQVIAGDAGGTVAVWDLGRGTLLHTLAAHGGLITTLQPAGEGLLVSAGRDDTVAVWNTGDWSERRRLRFPAGLLAAAANRDGQIAVATRDGGLQRFDATTGEALESLASKLGRAVGLRYSPDGRLLAAASERGPVALWETTTGEISHMLPLTATYLPMGLAFSPDGRTLATGPTAANPLTLWDVASGEALRTVPTLALSALDSDNSLAFSCDGDRLLVADQDQATRIYSLTPTRRLRTLTGHGGAVWDAALSPNGRFLLTGSEDGSMRLWDWQTGQAEQRFPGTPDRVFGVAYSPTGETVAAVGTNSAGTDGAVHIYLSGGAPQRTLTGHTSWVDEVVYSPDGETIATSGDDKTVRVWDWRRGRERWRVEGLPVAPDALAFSPDSALLAAGTVDPHGGVIHLWDAATGAPFATLTGHKNHVVGLAFSPDGAYLASASWDQTAIVWDIASGRALFRMSGHSAILTDVAFSPDGRRIATVAEDYTLRLWDAVMGDAVDRIDLPRSLPWSVSFSPDGVALITAHWDGTIRTWLADRDDDSLAALLLIAAARTPRAAAGFSGTERRLYGIDAYVGAYPLSASGDINLRPDTAVRSLVVYPGRPETGEPERLMALSDQQFLLRSTDRGTTWEVLGRLPLTLTVNSLGLPARGTDPLLLATEQGLYRYEPEGTLAQVSGEPLAGVSASHTNPDELWGIHGDTVVKSEDGGATWGAASSELLSSQLLAPLIMAPPNNTPQLVLGYGLASPGVQLWRGAANGFWEPLPGLPVLPLGLANGFGLAWDADNRRLYLGGPSGELYAVGNADAPDENAPAATLAHDFGTREFGTQNLGEAGRAVPLAVGQGPTLYVMVYGPFEPRFLRGVWDGTTWSWQALRLPLDAAG